METNIRFSYAPFDLLRVGINADRVIYLPIEEYDPRTVKMPHQENWVCLVGDYDVHVQPFKQHIRVWFIQRKKKLAMEQRTAA